MQQNSYAIECVNLTKTFDKQTVLDNLNFKIARGKITTILGFSGAGKSTLLKHILGLINPTHGQILVLGHDLSTLSILELREFRRKFGMLFQYAALFDSMSAFQNVAFPLHEFTNLSDCQIKKQVAELLYAVGIKEQSFDKLPSALSGGMRKRVGLARALSLQPKILLYDEPTTGLDPITTKMVNNLIIDTSKRLKDQGLTSIIISHDIKASLKISDYVAFLDHGKIMEHSPCDEFIKSTNPVVQQFLEL